MRQRPVAERCVFMALDKIEVNGLTIQKEDQQNNADNN
jgi:hypothetical protein